MGLPRAARRRELIHGEEEPAHVPERNRGSGPGPRLRRIPPDRRLQRGHHPAETLARELAKAWECPLEPLLVRVRGSPRQRALTRAQRRHNVEAGFASARPAPARVVLVDDVYTTGSTAHAAASALRKGGALEVEIVTFARTIRIR